MLRRFLNLNKIKSKRLSNHMSQNVIHNLNRYIWHFYPLNELISNVIPATGLKIDGMGEQNKQEKGEARNFEKIQLGEHLATN